MGRYPAEEDGIEWRPQAMVEIRGRESGNGVKRGRPGRRARDDWQDRVRDALAHLHDPVYLQTHPLAPVVLRDGIDGARARAGQALQRVLLDAIERLKPAADAVIGPHVL